LDAAFGTLPATWAIRAIEEAAEVHNSERRPIKELERQSMRGPYPYCGANGIVDYIDRFAYDGEYVLLAEDGGHWGRNEHSAYIMRGKFWVNNHAHVLRGRPNVLDNKFLSYMLTHMNIAPVIGGDSRGKLTKAILLQLLVPCPPINEQRQIAAVLSAVQQAIERQGRLIALTVELKTALMHKLFTEDPRGEPLKQTELGGIPSSWSTAVLRDLCEVIVDCPHTTPKFVASGVRCVRNYNIRDGTFAPNPAYFTSEAEYDERVRRAVPNPGDVLFSREAPVGEACVLPQGVRTSLGQRLMLIRTKRGKLDPLFLVESFYSVNVRSRMLAMAGGLTTPHLNVADVRNLPLPVPSMSDQVLIAQCVRAFHQRLVALRGLLTSYHDLFGALLGQLMSAQVRVGSLELSLLEEQRRESSGAE
jgi:type I restriction enzyme, S subunit